MAVGEDGDWTVKHCRIGPGAGKKEGKIAGAELLLVRCLARSSACSRNDGPVSNRNRHVRAGRRGKLEELISVSGARGPAASTCDCVVG